MCFSAGASFGASAVLCLVGVLAIKRTTAASQVLFAALPLIFSVQQFSEGLVWWSLSNPDYAAWQNSAIRCFLFFAQVLWPVWSPLAILLLEKDPGRKKLLGVLTAAGIVVSAYLAYHLALFPVHAEISSHHIHYDQSFPLARLWFSGLFYVVPTVLPLLVSTAKYMWIMAISILASYVVTLFLYEQYLLSVWCFFAAIISLEMFWIIRQSHKNTAPENALKFAPE